MLSADQMQLCLEDCVRPFPDLHIRTSLKMHTSRNHTLCFLLRLPLELRFMIYEKVFADVPTKTIRASEVFPQRELVDGSHGAWLGPSILRTCSQIRAEGLPQFRKRNIYVQLVDFDATQLIRYHNWLMYMKDVYAEMDEWTNRCTSIGPARIRDKEKARTNLLVWLEAYYHYEGPEFMLSEELAAWTRTTRARLDFSNVHRLAKFFAMASSLRAGGMEWVQAQKIMFTAFDLAFQIM